MEYVRTDWFYDLTVPLYENYEHKQLLHHNSATFTPKGRSNWTYDIFAKPDDQGNLPKDTELFHCRTSDNPFLPPNFIDHMRRNYTSTKAEQELEGAFVDFGGILFQRQWFDGQFIRMPPRDCMRVRYWDKAATKGGGCYTAGVLIGRSWEGAYYIESVVRGQWSPLERDHNISLTATLDAGIYGWGGVRIYVEQEPGSGGVDSVQSSIRQLAGHIVHADKVSGDKRTRAEPFAAQCEARNVFIVEGAWNRDYIDEIVAFPEGKYVDMVDASSGAFNQLSKGSYAHPVAGGSSGGGGPGAAQVRGPAFGLVGVPGGAGHLNQPGGLRNFRPR